MPAATVSLPSPTRLNPLHQVLRSWWREDAPTLGYVIKVSLACLAALWLSLLFDLEQPRTAMLTVAIVMQPRAGMVFAKSYYRLLGTLVGVAVSFLLVALFAQERTLFLLSMALWIGFCTGGSLVFRNHQSYGFVLAGYTLCIVGLPAALHPELTFDIGMTRISEILVGLLCATVVSDVVFPQRMWGILRANVRRRFVDFSEALRLAPEQLEQKAVQPLLLRFMNDIFSLETFRASTLLENDSSRAHRLRLSRLNSQFMAASTTFYALMQLLRRQYLQGYPDVRIALLQGYEALSLAITLDGHSPANEHEAARILPQLERFRTEFAAQLPALRKLMPVDPAAPARLDFETGVELLQRLADELHDFAHTYAALATEQAAERSATDEEPLRLGMHVDWLTVALVGLRGALALAFMAGFWILTDWRSGIEAITIGVVTSTLFATSPSPARTIRQFFGGAALGTLLAYVCTFHLLPDAQGALLLSLAILPGLAIAAWVSTRPGLALVGAGTFIMYLTHLGFGTTYNASPVGFINDSLADFFAILMSATMYALIDLSNSDWARKRLAKALRARLTAACSELPVPSRADFESDVQDLVQRSSSAQRIASEVDREVVNWLLQALEIGHAVIDLRALLPTLPQPARSTLQTGLDRLAELYAAPLESSRLAALRAIEAGAAALTQSAASAPAFAIVLSRLHFIRGALQDSETAGLMHQSGEAS